MVDMIKGRMSWSKLKITYCQSVIDYIILEQLHQKHGGFKLDGLL